MRSVIYKKSWTLQQCRCENLSSHIREYVSSHFTFQLFLSDVDAFSCDMGHLVSCFLLFVWAFKCIHSFIHSVLDLTTVSRPVAK